MDRSGSPERAGIPAAEPGSSNTERPFWQFPAGLSRKYVSNVRIVMYRRRPLRLVEEVLSHGEFW